jgi:enolase
MSNEKAIIAKLLDIAKKQQQAIHKLAQAQGLSAPSVSTPDPNLAYLKTAVSAAATNSGVTVPIGADVTSTAGAQQGNIAIEGTYTVNVRGMAQVDEKTKENFLKTYKNQIKAQKPELDGKVSIFFV